MARAGVLAFGYPFDHRVSRFAEAIAVIHGLLRHGRVDFEGAYYSARDCELRPRGQRPQRPADRDRLDRAAHAEPAGAVRRIWNAWARQTLQELAEDRDKVDAAMEAAGRDPATVERTVSLLVDLPTATGRPSEDKPGLKAREPEELAAAWRATPPPASPTSSSCSTRTPRRGSNGRRGVWNDGDGTRFSVCVRCNWCLKASCRPRAR